MDNSKGVDDRSPAGLMIIGGVLAIASAFLLWFEVETGGDGSGDRSYNGSDLMGTLGAGLIVLGIVLTIVGAMHWRKGVKGRGLAILATVVALFVLLTGVIGVAQPALALGSFGGDEVADDFGIADADEVVDALQEAEDVDTINIKPGLGPLAALAGGVLALLGGIFEIVRRRGAATHRASGEQPTP
jgi:hypothetical protein